MFSARQLLFMRRAGDRAIGIAVAPIGTVALLPDPDFRRRVFRDVIHVVARQVGEWIERTWAGASTRESTAPRPRCAPKQTQIRAWIIAPKQTHVTQSKCAR